MAKWYEPKNRKDIAHYVFVFSILALSWVQVMTFFGNQLFPTLLIVFVIFYIADKFAHHALEIK